LQRVRYPAFAERNMQFNMILENSVNIETNIEKHEIFLRAGFRWKRMRF
jgi:hypothetical protein